MSGASQQLACVFGLGWGDEGKGKIVDLLCPNFAFVVRFNGGANAGHTVCVGDEKFALHLLPTGVLHDNVTAVIGPGVVVDPAKLISEIDGLAARGRDISTRLRLSDRAHLVLDYHKIEDQLSERAAREGSRIGTTARGIGPCYADKMRRSSAVRFADLSGGALLETRVREIVASRRKHFLAVYGDDGGLDTDRILAALAEARNRLAPYISNTTELLHDAIGRGQRILFEGANGTLLDVDHGTYPFVTSSSTGPHGIGSGAGVPPYRVNRLIGGIKAYATRVGAGPFPSELTDAVGDRIRTQGHEFGTTTGRPRRCGWFDAVACRYSVRLTGATDIALMHLDTLSGFERVGICVGYRCDQQTITNLPADGSMLERAEPVLEFLAGWQENLRAIRSFGNLPQAARQYVERVESLLEVPVSIIGIGPERSQTLVRGALAELVKVPNLHSSVS